MKTERFLPTEQLRPWVKTFLIIDSEEGMVNRILPDTSIVMAFQCKGSVRYIDESTATPLSTSVLTGLRSTLRHIEYTAETTVLLALFQVGGATALLKEPLHDLFDTSVPLDQLLPRWMITETEEKLAEAVTNSQRVAIVEQFLLKRLTNNVEDKLVKEAVRRIQLEKGVTRINDLVTGLAIGQDPFEKRFRRIVGTSPKQFSEIVRLRSLIQQHSSVQSLTETAYLAGYYDQAHFIKTFKHFTGQTPNLFFRTGRFW